MFNAFWVSEFNLYYKIISRICYELQLVVVAAFVARCQFLAEVANVCLVFGLHKFLQHFCAHA